MIFLQYVHTDNLEAKLHQIIRKDVWCSYVIQYLNYEFNIMTCFSLVAIIAQSLLESVKNEISTVLSVIV